MRWYVEATKIGGHTPATTLVVDAEAWPKALQAARAIRGESGPIADFTIELLEDGCRAIEPHGLLTYRVTTAPDDTPLGEVRAPSRLPPRPTPSTPASRPSVPASPVSRPSRPSPSVPAAPSAAGAAPSRPSVPLFPRSPGLVGMTPPSSGEVPAAAPSAPVVTPPPPPPPAIEPPTAPEQAEAAPAPVDRESSLPSAITVFERLQAPTSESRLHYREYAFALPAGTSEEVAERVLFGELERLKKEMAALPSGKLVNLAAFDRIFTGRPTVLPIVTLAWKDWRSEPVLDHPLRRGTPAAPMPLSFPPASGTLAASDVARISNPPSEPSAPAIAAAPASVPAAASAPSAPASAPSVPASAPSAPASIPAAPSAPSIPRPAPSSARGLTADATIRIPPLAPPIIERDGPISADRHLDSLDLPHVPPDIIDAPVVHDGLPHDTLPPGPPPDSGSDPFPSSPAPRDSSDAVDGTGDSQREPRSFGSIASTRSSMPRMVFARKRADELLSVLFEAMYDLAFLRDATEGADFCVGLALEQIPAVRGFLHLYDMDKREFVVVAARGTASTTRLLERTTDRDTRFHSVMRQAGATIDGESVYAPVIQAGRHIGILEIDGALDQQPFGEAEGHALVYIARQYAEFVSQRGVVIDAKRVSEMPRSQR